MHGGWEGPQPRAAKGAPGVGTSAPRAVFFDFDNTLHDFTGAHARAFDRAAAPLAAGVPAPELRRRCAAAWRQTWDRFLAGAIGDAEFWRQRCAAVLAAADLPWDASRAAGFQQAFLTAMEAEIRPCADVEPALRLLADLRPAPVLGVLTNGPGATQRARVQRLGLGGCLGLVLVSGDFGRAKPEPAFFQEALRRAGVRADEAVMIGDDPETDTAGAKSAGLAAVWLDRAGAGWPDWRTPAPDRIVRDLVAAARWLARDGVG